MARPGSERPNIALHAERIGSMLRGVAEDVPANACSRVISGSDENTTRFPYAEIIHDILVQENDPKPLQPRDSAQAGAGGIYVGTVSHEDGSFPYEAFGLVRTATFAGAGTERSRDSNYVLRMQVQFIMRHRRGVEVVLNNLHNAAYGILAGAFVAWPGQTQPMGDGMVPVGGVDVLNEATATRGSAGSMEGWVYSSQVYRGVVRSVLDSQFGTQ